MEKIFLHCFPEDIEKNPLYFYETVMALAEDTLDKDVELRIRKIFEDLFAYSDVLIS